MILKKFTKLITALILSILLFSPAQIQAQSNSDSYFYQQRLICTNTYYNNAQYYRAASCYRDSWNNSCSSNAGACSIAANNIVIAMNHYKDEVCNPKFYNNDFSGAGACYDDGINQTCNWSPTDSNLCNIFKSNKDLAQSRASNQYCTINCTGSGSIYDANYNYQISQLQAFKINCNQNWYSGRLVDFRNCSQQGANRACSLNGDPANVLCSAFNNNVNLANNRINEINNWRNNGCFNYDYSYNSCNGAPVSDDVKTAAIILTAGVVICAVAGCFN